MTSSGGEWLSIEDLMEKISNKSAQERKMSQANHLSYSARMRGRSKQPIYTSDKRAKFTQRENKKWVRFVTVLGYIFSVSLPAISLSFYYIYVWDPGYIAKFPPEAVNKSIFIHKSPILPVIGDPAGAAHPGLSSSDFHSIQNPTIPDEKKTKIDLETILKDGLNSMESRESTSDTKSNTEIPNG